MTYFLILLVSLIGPLALSFDKKVAFYRKWKYLFPAIFFPALFYIAWDAWFTYRNIWEFNPVHISGIHLFNLPAEEVLFFFVVPYCCVFIYECIKVYFPSLQPSRFSIRFLFILALLLELTGIIFLERNYTFYTFIFSSIYIQLVLALPRFFRGFNPTAFLVSYAVILVPFLVVNGFLTAIPVVTYNNDENLGVRLLTIPLEDIFYGMLLILMNVSLFERFRNKNSAVAHAK